MELGGVLLRQHYITFVESGGVEHLRAVEKKASLNRTHCVQIFS